MTLPHAGKTKPPCGSRMQPFTTPPLLIPALLLLASALLSQAVCFHLFLCFLALSHVTAFVPSAKILSSNLTLARQSVLQVSV